MIKKQEIFKEITFGVGFNPYNYGLDFTDKKQLGDFYDKVVKN